jgi:DNA-binding GntR family transcriptional regulator
MSAPAEERSSSVYAYEVLAHGIATGALPPGTPIRERSDAARLGMSRTPFREALHRLELEGLVVRRSKRGTLVAPLDVRGITDSIALREAIEVAMAQRLAAHGSDLAPLEEMLEKQRDAAGRGDRLGFLAADEGFHLLIVQLAGNSLAVDAVRRCWLQLNRARYLAPLPGTARRAAVRDHEEILAAVRSGDPDGVRWAMRRHLDGPEQRLVSDLRSSRPEVFAEG